MKRRWSWAGFAASGFVALPAHAQVALDRFEPAPAGSSLLVVADAGRQESPRFAAAARLAYARSPLRLAHPGGDSLGLLVEHALTTHLQFGYSPTAPLCFDLDLPFALQSGRSAARGGVSVADPSGWALADVRLSAVYDLWTQRPALPAVAVQLQAWLPSGSATRLTGSGQLRYAGALVFAHDPGRWLLRASVGRRFQPASAALGGVLGSEVTFAAGARYRLGAASIGPELFGGTFASNGRNWLTRTTTNLELLVAGSLQTSVWRFSAAAGPGLTSAPGTPALRVIGSAELLFGSVSVAPRSAEVPVVPLPTAPAQVAVPRAVLPTVAAVSSAPPSASAATPDTSAPADSTSPPVAMVRVEGEQIVILEQVRFLTAKASIEPSSEPILQQVAELLIAHPEISRVAIDGHTDSVGSEYLNLELSRRRAVAVLRWLIAHGVDERRLEARGFGPRRPIADPKTADGRALNRRVEFLILKRVAEGSAGWKDGSVAP